VTRVPRSAYFVLFTVSGFAGLIYESIWTHYLKLFLGHAAYAQTLVLALFMGGMAIGSWLCSRRSGSWRNLLRGYAITEALIGVAAFAFHPIFIAATEAAYTRILPALGGATSAVLFKWTLAGLLILPQSVLLGMTFPLMSAGLIRRYPLTPGESLAMLYFTNSLGAAVGVLVSGFYMIDALGLPGTVQAAGVLNLVLAAVVWFLARSAEPPLAERQAAPATATAAAAASAPYRLFLVVALLTGSASFIYEIGWIRMLSLVLGSSTHSFELMLSAFILGLAFGGLWVRRGIDAIGDPKRFLGIVQVAMGLLALATLPLYGQMFDLMRWVMSALAKSDSGYTVFLLASDGIALAIMFPATFCAGMTLPLITFALLRGGHGEKTIGAVYAANTLGSILGVFAAAHLLMPLFGVKGLLATGAALDVALGLTLLWRIAGAKHLKLGATVLALVAFTVVLGTVRLDVYKMASGVFRNGDLYSEGVAKMRFYRDGKTATVSLMDYLSERSIRTNGKSDGVVNMDLKGPRFPDEITMMLTAALPLAYRPEAKDVAIIGIGTGLTTHTMLSSKTVQSVETVEIEPAMTEAARGFAPLNNNAFSDPRGRIIYDDAKTFFSTWNRKYDVIISEPSNPWVSGVSSLFTGEFYRLAQRHLKPGGVVVQWFQMYEIDVTLVASVMRALGTVFPDYVIYASTNNDLLIVAGDPETLAQPLADITRMPGLKDVLRRGRVETVGDVAIRRLGSRKALAPLFASYDVPANSDFYPYLDLHATKYRFLQQSAFELTNLGAYSVPVVDMLEGRTVESSIEPTFEGEAYLDIIQRTRRARYAHEFFLRPVPPEPVAIPPELQSDLELLRLRLIECREPEQSQVWLDALYRVGRLMNPLLAPAEARAVWDRIEQTPCYSSLPEAGREWIAMMKAVGLRDAPEMAGRAEALLAKDNDLPEGHRPYLLAAGMAGYLAQGKRAEARALWQKYPKDSGEANDLGLRLLVAHAFELGTP
jgi:predicted membrane-bound spermidine synthase